MDTRIAEEILRIRISQQLVNEAYKAKRFKVPVHLAFGHEAIAVAVAGGMETADKLLLSHRNIAYNLARETNLKKIMDEYLLSPEGLGRNMQGSMNLKNAEKGIIYSSSILGNNWSVAVGVAFAEALQGHGAAFVCGGDGSMEEGSFYESLVLAKSAGAPVLFIVENNEWSMATSIYERRCPIDVKTLVSALGIPYHRLEGNDAEAYIQTLKSVREEASKTQAPACVEVAVKTLGDWTLKTDDKPEGKLVKYHVGPAPEVSIEKQVIRENAEDPVFLVRSWMGEEEFLRASKKMREELEQKLV